MNPKKIALAGLLALASSLVLAQATPEALPKPGRNSAAAPSSSPALLGGLDVGAERSRIAAERKQVETRFTAHEAACYKKFAVNDCIEEGKADRRTRLADLRRQEITLNDAERKRKGAAQMQRMEEKEKTEVPQKELQRRERAKPRAATTNTGPGGQGEAAVPAPREPSVPKAPHPRSPKAPQAKDAAAAEALAAEEKERYERKLKDAAEHKAQTQKRNAERTKPAAKPLPPAT